MGWVYTFDEDLACKYGQEEAVMIGSLQYWIRKNRANKRNQNDGHWWAFNSMAAWSELYPFWSPKQIARILKSLIDQGVVITGNYNEKGYDRTLWYAFQDESEFIPKRDKSILPNGKMASPKQENGSSQTGEPIPSSPPSSSPTPSSISSRRQKVDPKEVRRITDYYQELFMEDYEGAKPTWDGKVIKLVHADISRLGDQTLGKLIQLFFEDPGDFVERNGTGKGYPVFHSQIDHLLERRARMSRGCA